MEIHKMALVGFFDPVTMESSNYAEEQKIYCQRDL
jgi:hypothetical protein